MLAEEGSESKNKDYKNYKNFHSRKFCREANLTDMFFRGLDTTDPIIYYHTNNSRIIKKKNFALTPELINILANPQIFINEDVPNEDSESEDDEADIFIYSSELNNMVLSEEENI